MSDIPEDVMRVAKEAARRSVERPYNAGTMKRATDVIAAALLAAEQRGAERERDRCGAGDTENEGVGHPF